MLLFIYFSGDFAKVILLLTNMVVCAGSENVSWCKVHGAEFCLILIFKILDFHQNNFEVNV